MLIFFVISEVEAVDKFLILIYGWYKLRLLSPAVFMILKKFDSLVFFFIKFDIYGFFSKG